MHCRGSQIQSLDLKLKFVSFQHMSKPMDQETPVSQDLNPSNFKHTRQNHAKYPTETNRGHERATAFQAVGERWIGTEPGCDHHSPESQYKVQVAAHGARGK